MNMVLYALYAAKQAGLEIPQQTWERAESGSAETKPKPAAGSIISLTTVPRGR